MTYVSIYKMWVYQMTGRGGGVRESAVKWSGKMNFCQGKVREFHTRLRVGTLSIA